MELVKVLIDAGHGGIDPGAIGGELQEKDANLSLSFLIASHLSWLSKGCVEVHFTRLGDTALSLSQRVEIERDLRPDLFVSIHCNSFTLPEPRGLEVYYYSQWSRGKRVAESIVESVLDTFPIHGEGSKQNHRFYVLKYTWAPAILVETLYVSNPVDRRLLGEFTSRNILAWTIAQGIWDAREVWM